MDGEMSGTSQLVDFEQLDMIADGFTDDFLEIYREFETDLPRILDTVKSAAQAGDASAMARAAHQAKGSAANFGLVAFSKLMATVESVGKSGTVEGGLQMTEDARKIFRESLIQIRAERGY